MLGFSEENTPGRDSPLIIRLIRHIPVIFSLVAQMFLDSKINFT